MRSLSSMVRTRALMAWKSSSGGASGWETMRRILSRRRAISPCRPLSLKGVADGLAVFLPGVGGVEAVGEGVPVAQLATSAAFWGLMVGFVGRHGDRVACTEGCGEGGSVTPISIFPHQGGRGFAPRLLGDRLRGNDGDGAPTPPTPTLVAVLFCSSALLTRTLKWQL